MILNSRSIAFALVFTVLSLLLGCQPDAIEPLTNNDAEMPSAEMPSADARGEAAVLPVLETYADTVAMRVYDASGGPAAWEALPYLRFTFSVLRQTERSRVFRHIWNRRTGDYRLELPGPANEPYVALFNVNTREGQVYWQGRAIDSVEMAKQLAEAYRRFTNDTYWLLAPFKLFDPGVHRAYVPDSSDAMHDVLHLTFDDVGMTPGDQYWLYVDKETGRLAQWSYVLQDYAPGTPPRSFVWEDYEEHHTPDGSLFFTTRKRGVGVPYAILTDNIGTPVPAQVPDSMFTAPGPILTPVDPNAQPFDRLAAPQSTKPKNLN